METNPVRIEELLYFNLKYLDLMNHIKVLLKDSMCIKKHIENLENGTLNEIPLYNLCDMEENGLCQN